MGNGGKTICDKCGLARGDSAKMLTWCDSCFADLEKLSLGEQLNLSLREGIFAMKNDIPMKTTHYRKIKTASGEEIISRIVDDPRKKETDDA